MDRVTVGKAAKAKQEPSLFGLVGDFVGSAIPSGRWFGLNPVDLVRDTTDEMYRAVRNTAFGVWSPAMDIRQCNGHLVISAEVPGLKRDDVEVAVTDGGILIRGQRKGEHSDDHDGYHCRERNYGWFYRDVPLPAGARPDELKADLVDGVLTVTVPVTPAARGKAENG